MTIKLFIVLFTIGSLISSLLTQAVKKAFPDTSSNILALCSAFFVGVLGMIAYYIINAVVFTPTNIIYIVLMSLCIWLESMCGYDKVMQLLSQIREVSKYE